MSDPLDTLSRVLYSSPMKYESPHHEPETERHTMHVTLTESELETLLDALMLADYNRLLDDSGHALSRKLAGILNAGSWTPDSETCIDGVKVLESRRVEL